MAHYAKVENGIVTNVIVAEADFIESLPDKENWIQTSYRTRGNVHYGDDGKPDGGLPLRGNFAGIGFIYDKENDVFYPLSPHQNAYLDKKTWTWTGVPVTILS